MTREQAVFRAVVWYEAVALASRGRVPPWTTFLMRLGPTGRVAVSIGAGLWMLRHLEVVSLRHPRGRVLP